jgi:hypothetical protein
MGSYRVLGHDEPFYWWNESAILLPGGWYFVSFCIVFASDNALLMRTLPRQSRRSRSRGRVHSVSVS